MAYQYKNPLTGRIDTAPSKEWYEANKGLLFPGTPSYTGASTGTTPQTLVSGQTTPIQAPLPPTQTQPTVLGGLQQQLKEKQTQLKGLLEQQLQNKQAQLQAQPKQPTNVLGALGDTAGVDTGTDYRQQLIDIVNKLQTQQGDYLSTLKDMPTPVETYQTYREQLGLPAAEQRLTGLQTQVQKTEDLLTTLEKDINARIQGRDISEPLRRRTLATEQRPLQEQLAGLSRAAGIEQTGVQSARQQLSQLLQLAQQGQSRQEMIAKAPFEMTKGLLPTISSLAQYQSPEEKLAQQLKLAEGKEKISQKYAITKPTTTTAPRLQLLKNDEGQPVGYFNPQTGQITKYNESPIDKTGLTDTEISNLIQSKTQAGWNNERIRKAIEADNTLTSEEKAKFYAQLDSMKETRATEKSQTANDTWLGRLSDTYYTKYKQLFGK